MLPKGLRPGEVCHWIKCGRHIKLVEFGKDTKLPFTTWPARWWAWWKDVQPADRIGPDDALTQPDQPIMDWSSLDYHGDNGLVSFVVSAYCWGRAVKDSGSGSRSEWLAAVRDISWCLHRLVMDVDCDIRIPSSPSAANQKRCAIHEFENHSLTFRSENDLLNRQPPTLLQKQRNPRT